MGYSASGGPKGLGVVTDSNTPLADFNKIIELIARVGNYRGPMTETERDEITGAALYAGLLVYNTTRGRGEVYTGSGWSKVFVPDQTVAVTMQGIYKSHPSYPITVRVENGRAFLEGQAYTTETSAPTFTVGDNYLLATIPAAFAPQYDQLYVVPAGPTNSARLSITPSGQVIFSVLSGFTAQLSMGLGHINWKPKP